MKVKTTILAATIFVDRILSSLADESMAEVLLVQQQVKGIRISGPYLIKRNLHFQVLM